MRIWFILLLSLLLPVQARGACAPETLARIVFRDATPGIDRESFAGQPKTLYRLGDRYFRMEEAPDAEHGIHGLLITAEPDSWLINLADRSGRHIVDRSTPFVIHAQVFGGPEDPEILKSFEFGCELAYMKARGSQPVRATIGRFTLDNYKVTEGAHMITLSIIAGSERPLFASHFKNGVAEKLYQYVQYDLQLKPDPHLFEPPTGIKIEEVKP
jgi:hypothetical protein